jgi:hypothetical protein
VQQEIDEIHAGKAHTTKCLAIVIEKIVSEAMRSAVKSKDCSTALDGTHQLEGGRLGWSWILSVVFSPDVVENGLREHVKYFGEWNPRRGILCHAVGGCYEASG